MHRSAEMMTTQFYADLSADSKSSLMSDYYESIVNDTKTINQKSNHDNACKRYSSLVKTIVETLSQ